VNRKLYLKTHFLLLTAAEKL